jgi:hypothetical protein
MFLLLLSLLILLLLLMMMMMPLRPFTMAVRVRVHRLWRRGWTEQRLRAWQQ